MDYRTVSLPTGETVLRASRKNDLGAFQGALCVQKHLESA